MNQTSFYMQIVDFSKVKISKLTVIQGSGGLTLGVMVSDVMTYNLLKFKTRKVMQQQD